MKNLLSLMRNLRATHVPENSKITCKIYNIFLTVYNSPFTYKFELMALHTFCSVSKCSFAHPISFSRNLMDFYPN